MNEYQCPGESYTITRAVHLGRLASYYPKCRHCAHRGDTATLSANQVKRFKETWRREEPGPLLGDEGLLGVYRNQLTPEGVRVFAAAFAAQLVSQKSAAEDVAVVVAGDGRRQAPEMVNAAAEGIRFSGCSVVDIGRSTSGCLVCAIDQLRAGGGLLVGNPTGDAHRVGLKLWGSSGQPLSAGGSLEQIARQAAQGIARPTRACGGLSRLQVEADYLAGLQPYFHALRPLRFVLDTLCQPLTDWLRGLTASVACQFTPFAAGPSRTPIGEPKDRGAAAKETNPADADRMKNLGRQVCAEHAHFGMWIDGDGEVCRLVDERGRQVVPELLLLTLARHEMADNPAARVVLEHDTQPQVGQALKARGVQVFHSGPRRAEMHLAMLSGKAALGGGPSGRIWFGAPPVRVDALQTVARLLTILSQSDRPLSDVVAGSITGIEVPYNATPLDCRPFGRV